MSRLASLILEVLSESASHLLSMLPLLFVAYLVTEILSHRSAGTPGTRATALSFHPLLGPAVAAALGLLPQCGFAAAATVMYLDGLIPRGTLISSYIATSDEALPVLISDEGSLPWVLPLLITKFAWGTACGIAVNLVGCARRSLRRGHDVPVPVSPGEVSRAEDGERTFPRLCGRPARSWQDLLIHAATRTLRVGLLLFALSSGFHILAHLGFDDLGGLAGNGGVWQELLASVVGLFPSCATSVAIAGAFQRGILSFPATVAGLVSNAGVALALLFKEAENKRDPLVITALLVLAAFLAGVFLRVAGSGD